MAYLDEISRIVRSVKGLPDQQIDRLTDGWIQPITKVRGAPRKTKEIEIEY